MGARQARWCKMGTSGAASVQLATAALVLEPSAVVGRATDAGVGQPGPHQPLRPPPSGAALLGRRFDCPRESVGPKDSRHYQDAARKARRSGPQPFAVGPSPPRGGIAASGVGRVGARWWSLSCCSGDGRTVCEQMKRARRLVTTITGVIHVFVRRP